jgi:hypothetical protein
MSTRDARALDLLRETWAGIYSIDHDGSPLRWWAERIGVAYRIVTAASAEELSRKVTEDYGAAG